jgi:LysR family transcriptional regulator for bpeEF and oprC
VDKLVAMQTFVRVVDTGTFTRAADLLGVPKSTVTRLVQMLEKEVGVKLLHRTTRQLTVTQEGAVYYEGAIRLLDQVGQLDASVASATKAPKGKIKVDVPGAIAYKVILPALPTFFAQYPSVQIDLSVGNRSIDLISENIDCVVRLGPLLNDFLIARPLGMLQMVTCASSVYLERHGMPSHPADLEKNHTLIQIASPRSGRGFTDELHRDSEKMEIAGSHQISVNDSTAALISALAGLGVATTYDFLVREHVETGLLQRLFPDWNGDLVPAHVAYPANRHLAHKVRVFVDWVMALFVELTVKK